MFTWNSFLQTLFQFVKAMVINVSKQMYRNWAVLTAGCMIVFVATFTSAGFGGSGRNALAAYSQVYPGDDGLKPDPGALLIGAGLKEGLNGREPDAEAFADGALLSETPSPSGQAGLEENKAELADIPAQSARVLIGSVLKQDAKEKLESEQTIRERVGQAQKEIRVQQVRDAAEKAAEEARKREEEIRKAAVRIPYSQEDYQVMLRIVQAEAGGCDSTGKILVANVIMNRVRSSEFPDSITSVVYEKSQFSPVSDGSIDRVSVSQDTINCVDRALDGEDYSQGALYFMNRKASYSGNVSWFDRTRTFLFTHGGHEFFK
ncbi:MAG: cell wall hydrolase [Lachnospiraceae bacterium]|jgi:N-acetylmuramoyl-L-alanine amidase|nr:cell wall hydrolase [Lachnospiraceae bacterium]